MEHTQLLTQLRGGLIVSCQAMADEPLFGDEHMLGNSRRRRDWLPAARHVCAVKDFRPRIHARFSSSSSAVITTEAAPQ